MKNPVPCSKLFVTPTLEVIAEQIERMPATEQATAYMIMMMTMNACHQLVEEAQ